MAMTLESPMTELEQAIDGEANEYIALVIDAVRRAEAEGFTSVETDAEIMAMSATAYWESYYSLGAQVRPGVPRLFKPHLHPHLGALGTVRSYHQGSAKSWEFLHHEFNAEGERVVVIDGVNDILVRLPGHGAALVTMTPEARAAEVARLAGLLFADPWEHAVWLPRGSAGETAGISFTTARG